jgi:hypothetical protein
MSSEGRTLGGEARVDLYWLPLGAGGRLVRRCGAAYERLVAWRAGRRPLDLYHAALEVTTAEGRFAIELTPVQSGAGSECGVVGEGAVGTPLLRALRLFRYELHATPGGAIPDIDYAVESPRRVGREEDEARRVLDLLPSVPLLTWGRDELDLGEMWNSNSVVSWLLASADLDLSEIGPPRHGRAPGWRAGIAAAHLAAIGTNPPDRCGVSRMGPRGDGLTVESCP